MAIIAEIDAQIAILEKARAALLDKGTRRPAAGKKGRKGKMSAEGRARIAAAQKKRWAAMRRAQK